ncbi:RimJ/RimL family protein N-acetyltransferase [Mycetocola sp. BIGb0189]|uniref:GNAT family N-acetyltransferase n=1 Tax=Mycetocola sp. BIGb0189 TaxID=2940604 RepID=UPI00216929F1|nr:GNAT family N-acetyltransferase [Mycetocola sp. BIGb0189]MCS4277371.1 RimJ/RimL family protein N-acetyltransferase [Mycetocola sp. BIGb0189]
MTQSISLSPFSTARLDAEPLTPGHADEAFTVLNSTELHRYIGGEPLAHDALTARYERLAAGSPAEISDVWANWLLRVREGGHVVGTVQATISVDEGTAAIAWVVGVDFQRRGFASEAARGLVGWLHAHGVTRLEAFIHPENLGSNGVARALGLERTGVFEDGEEIWRSPGFSAAQ